jgi:hypothetical protein
MADLSDLSKDSGADVTIPTDAGDASDAGVAIDAGDANAYTFSDDFNRADSATIGNAWIEKNPAFQIASGRALRVEQSNIDFRDLVVYRPANEAYLDITATMEVVLANVDAGSGSWEQLHVRIQPSSIAQANTLDAYIMFAQSGGKSALTIARSRQQQPYFVLGSFQLSTPMVVGTTYRFTLQAKGVNPVNLIGQVERFDNPGWTTLGSGQFPDGDKNNAIVTPGVVGFSASNADPTGAYSYDNFAAWGN